MESTARQMISVIQSLSEARTLEQVMAVMAASSRAMTGADGATFVLRDGDFCHYADENAVGPLWKGKKFPLTSCISGWAMLNKKPAVIPDIFVDPRIPIEAYRPTFVKSLVMVPIHESSPIGAIGNYWATNHQATDEQVEILQALANTAAVALENVRLYQDLEKRLDELHAAMRAKEDFLKIISHELRTPLNAIHGWSQLMAEGTLSADDLKIGADTIVRNVRTQTRVIQDLVDASAIVSGGLSLRRESFDMRTVVETAVNSLLVQANEKLVTMSTILPDGEVVVLGDVDRAQQACMNLISNAVKFSSRGHEIQVSLAKEGPSAVFRVRDQGEGIAAEFLPRLFHHFSQADSSMSRRYQGLGLGLTLVRHIAEAMGGSVSAASDGPGKGATFTLSLPLFSEN